MKKATSKKLIGSLLIIMLLAIIGAVLVTAEISDTTLDEENVSVETNDETGYNDKPTTFGGRGYICGQRPFFFNLTDEQRDEIDKIVTSLREEGASCLEIREAIFAKFDEYGIWDQKLEYEINCTEKRLEILYRQKELREEGYNWDEIKDIIQDEFDLELPIGHGKDIMFGHSF